MRGGAILVLVLLASMARAGEPAGAGAALPDPEIAWIVENSMVGNPERQGIRLSLESSRPRRAPPLDVPGVDLDWGRRLLVDVDQAPVATVSPESLVVVADRLHPFSAD